MAQATATLQQRIARLDRKLSPSQREELASLVRLLGFELKPIKVSKPKTGKPKFRWYRPPTLASLCVPYGKRMPWVKAGTTAIEGSACYTSRVPLCPSNWPQDIAAFYASK
jgi:hypothetical protein